MIMDMNMMGMNMKTGFRRLRRQEWIIFFFVLPLLFSGPARAGSYLLSAHGSSTVGVLRPIMGDAPPAGFGYARGNCAHCHEQHASVGGTEPAPVGGAAPYTLFALNFDTGATTGPYLEANDFCFYCHNSSATVQVVANNDYSQVFGGSTTQGPLDILAAFNQLSYHNLNDIQSFADTNFSWFTGYSNPCNACHNPHLARQNWANPQDVTYSAISNPSTHFALATQTMGDAYSTQYEPPYCSGGLSTDREPAASADAATGRANTPDYVALCTDCHNSTNTITSTSISTTTTTGRTLLQIDWGASAGDQHGAYPGSGTRVLKAPYLTAGSQNSTNYVLSCLDCHEPHGSPNITLLRRRVNGGDLAVVGTITTALPDQLSPATSGNNNNREMGYLCMRCHQQDSGTGTDPVTNPPKWENVHHWVTGHPYAGPGSPGPKQCTLCHGGPPQTGDYPVECDKCHFHGGTDAWLSVISSPQAATPPRKTF